MKTAPSELLVLSGQLPEYSLSIVPKAEVLKNDALLSGLTVVHVTNDQEQEEATEVAQEIKGLLDMMETTRKSVKRPIIEAGKDIDSTAQRYTKELEQELARIKGLISTRVLQVQREAQEAHRKLEAERLRVEALKREEERLQAEADAAKGREAKKALAKLEEARTERIEAELESFETTVTAETAPLKVPGMVHAAAVKITVTDIHALYAFNKFAVKMEPNMALLRQMHAQGMTVPGVTFTEDVNVRISGTSPQRALR